jgi:DNA-directed RNA polymerase subunit RPC12/RpoP
MDNMAEKKKLLGSCSVCGKDLYEGDDAYATSTGKMDAIAEGFYMDTFQPWGTVACKECGSKISTAIASLIEAKSDVVVLSKSESKILSELLLEFIEDNKYFKNGCPDEEEVKRVKGNIEQAGSLVQKLSIS